MQSQSQSLSQGSSQVQGMEWPFEEPTAPADVPEREAQAVVREALEEPSDAVPAHSHESSHDTSNENLPDAVPETLADPLPQHMPAMAVANAREEQRHKALEREAIAQEAYRIAESRGFPPDGDVAHWLEAERRMGTGGSDSEHF